MGVKGAFQDADSGKGGDEASLSGYREKLAPAGRGKCSPIIAETEIKGKITLHDLLRMTFLRSHGVGGRTLVPQRCPHSWSPGHVDMFPAPAKGTWQEWFSQRPWRAGTYPGIIWELQCNQKGSLKESKEEIRKTETEVRTRSLLEGHQAAKKSGWPLKLKGTGKQGRSLPILRFTPCQDFLTSWALRQ